MKYLMLSIVLISSASCVHKPLERAPSANRGRYAIEGSIFGKKIVISTSDQFAGAIDSVVWDRKEFINRDDHGRQLQSASSYDGYGECLNPTEAGSGADGDKRTTSSQLMGISTENNVLKTTSRMAYWTAPGTKYPQGCGLRKEFTAAINTTVTSNDILSKEVRIGFQGIENVLEYLVSFKTNEPHESATFEALTGYMPADFSSFWTYDPTSSILKSIDYGPGEQALPIILSTPDQRFAMGIYSPDLPMATYPAIGYGRFAFIPQKTTKWNAVFRENNIPAATFSYKMYVSIGNLQQVQKGIQATYRHFNANGNTGGGTAKVAVKATTPPTAEATFTIHRYYNPQTGEHFYTAYPEEVSANRAYRLEGPAFKLYAKDEEGNSRSLYRCLAKTGMHFGSPDPACEGSTVEGLYGYLRKKNNGTGPALYRSFNKTNGDHLLTTNAAESKAPGYELEAEIGYTAP